MNFIDHSLHIDYSKPQDQCLECQEELENLKEWYGKKPSEEIDPEYEQERAEILLDQMREDGYHNHSGNRR